MTLATFKNMNPAPPQLDVTDMSLYSQSVDSILRRFNDPAQRAEAGVAAALLLQAMQAMGVFKAPPIGERTLRGQQTGPVTGTLQNTREPTPEEIVEKERAEKGRFLEAVDNALKEPPQRQVRPLLPPVIGSL